MNITSNTQSQVIQSNPTELLHKVETAAIEQGSIEPRAVENNEKITPTKSASEQLSEKKEVERNQKDIDITYNSKGAGQKEYSGARIELVA